MFFLVRTNSKVCYPFLSSLKSTCAPLSMQSRSYCSKKLTGDGEVIVVTSGKGGVGKTTTTASLGFGLAERGYKTCVIDFDVGLRNLDIHFGMERRIIYDFVNVINGEANLHQALVKDKRNSNLLLLAASQTKDKTALTEDGVQQVLNDLRKQCDFILCDSPAGIESGAYHAMLFADKAVICTNPELSSVRDSDKMIGFISSKSQRALENREPVQQSLLITRYNPERVEKEDMLSVDDIKEMLGIPVCGVIPESQDVLLSINYGKPVVMNNSNAGMAYSDAVGRLLGEEKPLRFTTPEKKTFFSRFFPSSQ
mmetsp:Transcript_23528/g.40245  ORF Transcript_23528/g.40245 Transcript_23528/m.40245 type:complete len:311 (-) Transcript_23528:41-973(-)